METDNKEAAFLETCSFFLIPYFMSIYSCSQSYAFTPSSNNVRKKLFFFPKTILGLGTDIFCNRTIQKNPLEMVFRYLKAGFH